jgi:glycosyltransferase involved in cell wall biosynthesis
VIQELRVGVVIPCYKVSQHLLSVLNSIPEWVDRIYLIDDACPQNSVQVTLAKTSDPRIVPILLKSNIGVGGAVKSGYVRCLDDEIDIVVRVDGDGQMDLKMIQALLHPILSGDADFTKGNRFFNIEDLVKMPKRRIFGNIVLSFFSKFSSGYWDIFDPNNGFNAIILSPLAVGFGVNIVAANHVIHFTRTWNPAKEGQATDRAYRIGQTKDVNVYCPTITAEDFVTFDEKLDRLMTLKMDLAGDMLDGVGSDISGSALMPDSGPFGVTLDLNKLVDIYRVDTLDGSTFEIFCVLLFGSYPNKSYITPKQKGDGGVDFVVIGNDKKGLETAFLMMYGSSTFVKRCNYALKLALFKTSPHNITCHK